MGDKTASALFFVLLHAYLEPASAVNMHLDCWKRDLLSSLNVLSTAWTYPDVTLLFCAILCSRKGEWCDRFSYRVDQKLCYLKPPMTFGFIQSEVHFRKCGETTSADIHPVENITFTTILGYTNDGAIAPSANTVIYTSPKNSASLVDTKVYTSAEYITASDGTLGYGSFDDSITLFGATLYPSLENGVLMTVGTRLPDNTNFFTFHDTIASTDFEDTIPSADSMLNPFQVETVQFSGSVVQSSFNIPRVFIETATFANHENRETFADISISSRPPDNSVFVQRSTPATLMDSTSHNSSENNMEFSGTLTYSSPEDVTITIDVGTLTDTYSNINGNTPKLDDTIVYTSPKDLSTSTDVVAFYSSNYNDETTTLAETIVPVTDETSPTDIKDITTSVDASDFISFMMSTLGTMLGSTPSVASIESTINSANCSGMTDYFAVPDQNKHIKVFDGLENRAKWQEASSRCEEEYAKLARIDDDHQRVNLQALLTQLGANGKEFWLGANDFQVEGVFYWWGGGLQADAVAPYLFENGQPDNGAFAGAVENCLLLGNSTRLKDGNCESKQFFICQCCATVT